MPKTTFVRAAALSLLAACTPAPQGQVSKRLPLEEGLAPISAPQIAMTGGYGSAVARPNVSIARDFLRLTFAMESGRALPSLTRFEGPITVRLTGDVPASAEADLTRLIGRLRAEAGLDISQVGADQPASITVEFRTKAELAAAVQSAACFVVPGVSSFEDYRRNHSDAHVSWANLTRRQTIAVFAPSNAGPQEVRDCLHEELAQAMGPVNDLYYLTDSIFNDDNFNSTLTSFDMLVLKAYYSPELANGMNEAEVAKRLPAILARINPAGQRAGDGTYKGATSRAWIAAVEASFTGRGSMAARVSAARQMLTIAQAQGWSDGRMAFSHYAVGRALLSSQPQEAVEHLARAARIYASEPGGQMHSAHVDMQLAAIALSAGQDAQAIAFADRALPHAKAGENAALVTSLMLIKAEALEGLGQADQARALRLDSQPWARYGFGSDQAARAQEGEIRRLAKRG